MNMSRTAPAFAAWMMAATVLTGCGMTTPAPVGGAPAVTAEPSAPEHPSPALVAEGQRIFRFETFGDEQLWTDALGLNQVVEKSVDPTTALKIESISRARRRRSRSSR